MTPATGITQGRNPDESVKKANEISFSIDFDVVSDRKIAGCAHLEAEDLEHEIIEINAIRKALDNFMRHPFLHYQHTERPIGTVTKAEIIDKGLYIEGSIFDTDDTDDVWKEIQKGSLNKYSIYGIRKQGSPACRCSPETRSMPCVTKAIDLWSISVVGSNAINQNTFLDVVKSLKDDIMTEDVIEKAEGEETTVEKGAIPGTENINPPDGALIKAEQNITELLKRIDTLEKSFADVNTCYTKHLDTFHKAVEETSAIDEPVQKASVVDATEDVVQKAVDGIVKAFNDKLDTVLERLDTVETQTVQKGGTIAIIPSAMTKEDRAAFNPMIQNADLIGAD